MSFKEWLDEQCKERSNKLRTESVIKAHKFKRLKLANGVSLSVQASEFHFCEPEETLYENKYNSVEVYASDEDIEALNKIYFNGDIYKYVPVSIMEEVCRVNGGIVND